MGKLGEDREIIKVLGQGSFGKVAQCTNLKTKKTEAVKILKCRRGTSKSVHQEIANLRRLECLDPDRSHIVRFNTYFFHRDDVCLSFELLDVDLRTYMNEASATPPRRGLALPDVRGIARQLATALDHLRAIAIIHGDIKPENVMVVDRQQRPLQVKLVDFGGAQLSSQASCENLVHTFSYSSPEVLLMSSVNEATDIWSVGLTAVELALGAKLFRHKDCYNMLRGIVTTIGQPPDRVLDVGTNTRKMFNSEPKAVPRWRMKTVEQYEFETYSTVATHPEPFRCLGDIRRALTCPPGFQDELDQFLDLVKRMLEVDPDKRPAPADLLRHPFLAIKQEGAPARNSKQDKRENSIPTCLILIGLLLLSIRFILGPFF